MGRWRETIGHGFGTGRNKGGTKKWAVTDEFTGKVGGHQVEHWDDRLDAYVKPETVRWSFGPKGEPKDG